MFASVQVVHAEDCGKVDDPCGKQTSWNDFESIRLRTKQSGAESSGHYFLQSSRKNGDLRLEIDFSDPKNPQKGTIMMVEGGTMVSTGIVFSQGREIDMLDVPLMTMILAGKVMSRALPKGAESVVGKREFQHEDKSVGIQFATPSAQGFIPPPWSARGFVQKNADGSFDFDFMLAWQGKDMKNVVVPASLSLAGQLKRDTDFQIDNNMSLVGWNVFDVGPIVEKSGGATRYDYGATALKSLPATVADIRKAIAIENSPGEMDLTMNFAGFWKEKCTEKFGLRIQPVEPRGMYTVTFCGPGGCGDEQNPRKTFIKGDKRYQVVSASELLVGREGNKSTYRKCSERMLP